MSDTGRNDEDLIYGRNVILSYLERASLDGSEASQLDKIYLGQGLQFDRRIEKIKQLAREQSVPIMVCDKQQMEKMVGSQSRHQGVVARVSQAKTIGLAEFIESLRTQGQESENKISNVLVAIADGIQDPHNLGALIRVAHAAGARGLITAHRRSAGTTGTVAKASAGAIAYLPIVKVKNIVSAIEELKKAGFWIAGLDASGKNSIYNHNLQLPLAVVIGGEGRGLSRLVADHCDFLLRIPMAPRAESLNAAVAGGIVFYEYLRQNLCEEK